MFYFLEIQIQKLSYNTFKNKLKLYLVYLKVEFEVIIKYCETMHFLNTNIDNINL